MTRFPVKASSFKLVNVAVFNCVKIRVRIGLKTGLQTNTRMI